MTDEQNSQQDEREVEGQGFRMGANEEPEPDAGEIDEASTEVEGQSFKMHKKANEEPEPDAGEATTDDSPEVEGQRYSGIAPVDEVAAADEPEVEGQGFRMGGPES